MIKPLFVFLLASVTLAHADAGNRVALVESASTDYAMRIKMIRSAERTVDLIMSHHTADSEIGLPILLAMREAAKRGVKIRMITGYLPAKHSKAVAALRILLNDDTLPTRPEMIMDGKLFKVEIPSPDARMWTSFDEKIMIVDAKHAVIGGRNVGREYLHWLDNSLYLDGPVVQEIQTTFFEPTWNLAVSLFGNSRQDVSKPWPWQHESYGPLKITPPLAAGMPEAERLMAQPQYNPPKIEILHNGLIARMMQYRGRHMPAPTPDPILETFLDRAQHAKRVYFYSLYPAADKRLAAGLGQAVRNGANVVLITNSLPSAKNLDSTGIPYDGSLTSMIALAYNGVKVQQLKPSDQYRFMHQKMAVVDDVVIFGSHNFNYSSTHSYDQMNLVIHDKALADTLAAQFEDQVTRHTTNATESFLRWQRKKRWLSVQAAKLLLGLY